MFGTGAGLVALAGAAVYGDRAHRLDDLARKAGLDPRRLPAASDDALIKRVQNDQTMVLMSTLSAAAEHPDLAPTLAPLIKIARTQLADLGGVVSGLHADAPAASSPAALDAVITVHQHAAAKRARDSLDAVSGDFAQVLASISASLAQGVVVLRDARKALA